MKTVNLPLAEGLALLSALTLSACSGGSPNDDDAGPGVDGAVETPDAATTTSIDAGVDASYAVTFQYRPSWSGATAVTVLGSFGEASDWSKTQPFAELTDDGTGNFVGTANLPAGQYLYLFHVIGDSAGAVPATFARYAIDPGNPAFAPCPSTSPSYSAIDANPCSQLTVPRSTSATTWPVQGVVNYAGAPIAGYLVEVERDEASSHHYFANRTTTASDGTFQLAVAAGTYRLQVLHPTYLSVTDAKRDPLTLKAFLRSLSSTFLIGGDLNAPPVDLAYDAYSAMRPQGISGDAGVPLPASFSYALVPGATSARLAIYGPGQNIGDPWYATPYSTDTAQTFDGGFNTKQATETAVVSGEKYFWGTWQQMAHDGGVAWTGESMVFPIAFE